ncbi:MAG: hypothetical protein J6D03_09060 [Clostridia bacterium]|nr:hypothetical protein [Clostridia bacterium]
MYEEIKKLTKELKHFPSMQEWNKYAVENNLLSAVTLEYVLGLKWKELKEKVEKDLEG